MKKLLSLALVAAMVLTSFTFVYAADLVSGLTGSGTEADPVLITSVADYNTLAAASASDTFDGKYFKLTNNLDFAGAAISTHIGSETTYFKGVFNGNGKIISNYKISNNGNDGGLFGTLGGNGEIKNLGVEGVSVIVDGDKVAGGIVARVRDNAKVSGCFARNFTGNQFPASEVTTDVGGVVGQLRGEGTILENSYALNIGFGVGITVNNDGELFGSAREFTEIRNCYANAYMGVVYSSQWNKIKNCYFTTTLETSYWPGWYNPVTGANDRWSSNALAYIGYKLTDAELKANAADLGEAYKDDSDSTLNGGYPVLSWQGGTAPALENLIEGLVGAGVEVDPVLITSVADYNTLAAASASDTFDGKYFKLTNNLDFQGATIENTIGTDSTYFKGIFDGNSKIVSNYKISNKKVGGLFGVAGGNSVIKNLGVEGVTVITEGEYVVGGIVGRLYGSAKVSGCFARNFGEHTFPASEITTDFGGIVGQLRETGTVIENCYAINTGFGNNNVPINNNGELFGSAREFTEIKNCYANNYIGVLYNNYHDKIKNCYFTTTLETSFWPGWYNPETGVNDRWSTNTLHYVGYKLTDAQLKTYGYYLGEAFNDDSENINNGYPVLDWQGGTPSQKPAEAGLILGLEGKGTEADPVLIKSCADWETFVTALNADSTLAENGKHYKLAADLDFADYTWTNKAHVNAFYAHLDGDGHVIKNFSVGGAVRGLFYIVWNDALIENLGMVDVTFSNTSDYLYGAIIGRIRNGNLKNCYVYGIKESGSLGGEYGGLIGQSFWSNGSGVNIENCYVVSRYGDEGYVGAGSKLNGLVGALAAGSSSTTEKINITNSYSDTSVLFTTNKKYDGATVNANITNSYYVGDNVAYNSASLGTDKTADELKGLAATLGTAFVADTKYINNGYPVLAWQKADGALSKNANLASLTVSAGDLEPVFASGKTEYTVYVLNEVDKITVNAVAADELASVTGTVTDKDLVVGDNTVTITVTAEDASVVKTYTVVVKRLKAGEDVPKLLPDEAPADAILITTVAELQALANATTAGKYYVLGTDIDLQDADWTTFIGTAAKPFEGTFHGYNHVIRNAKIRNTGTSSATYGIFGVVGGNAVIKNLGVENISCYTTITTGNTYDGSKFGGMIGLLQGNAKVESCFAKNVSIDTKVKSGDSWSGVQGTAGGGLIGYTDGGNCEILNCYSIDFVEADDSVGCEGGLIGGMPEGTFKSMTNCYSNTHLSTCKSTDVSKIVNCYTTITTGWSMFGTRPGTAVTDAVLKSSAAELGEAYSADIQGLNNGYPMLAWEMNLTRLEGNGTEETPFLITDVDTLAQVAGHRDTAGKYYKLVCDIDFAGAKLVSFIGKEDAPFEGIFDGNGHIIKNFVIEPPVTGMWTELGIFAYIGGNAIVRNIGIENVTVSPEGEWGFNSCVGGLVAVMTGNAKVTDCYVKNMTFKNDNDAMYNAHTGGGLIGKMLSGGTSVENCYAMNVTELKDSVAMFNSLIGSAKEYSSIKNCYSNGSLTMTGRKNVNKISNSYRLEDPDGTALSQIGILTKAAVLKTKATDLGTAFAVDSALVNEGYPVLDWEVK